MHNFFLPISQNGLYYIFDVINRALIPCKELVYNYYADKIKDTQDVPYFINDILGGDYFNCTPSIFLYKEVSRKDLLNSIANVPQIVLEITEKCNLHCVYCCYGELFKKTQHEKNGDKIAIVERLKLLLLIRKKYHINAPLRITFYGGEPLLRFDIITECVRIAKESVLNTEITFGLTTNGILLDKYIEYLVENDFHLTISIDGNRESNSYRITKSKKESYNIVKHNIDNIYRNYPHFFDKNVSFNSVLHNKNTTLEVISFFSRWQKKPNLSYVSQVGGKKNNKLLKEISLHPPISNEEISGYKQKKYLDEEQNESRTINSWLWDVENKLEISDFNNISNHNKYIYPGATCRLFQNRVFITVDGDILPCEKISRKFKFGKINNGIISFYIKKINHYYSQINSRFENKCTSCYKSFGCKKCFFSDIEEIKDGLCYCNKQRAIKETSL